MENSIIDYAAARIYNIFDVTIAEARTHARDIVEYVEANGGAPTQALIDELIEPEFDRKLRWRDPVREEQFHERRTNGAAGHNEYIDRAREEWRNKWK